MTIANSISINRIEHGNLVFFVDPPFVLRQTGRSRSFMNLQWDEWIFVGEDDALDDAFEVARGDDPLASIPDQIYRSFANASPWNDDGEPCDAEAWAAYQQRITARELGKYVPLPNDSQDFRALSRIL
jgi:hypothetical protein